MKGDFLLTLLAASLLLLHPSVGAFSPEFRGDGRLFLDTADTKEWDELLPTGIFHGVTTNPILLERAGQPCTIENLNVMAAKALQMTDEFMCQSWGSTVEELVQCGMKLSQPARDRIVVKVPVTMEGVQAATKLIQAGVRVCLTACYHHKQAMIAASVGAEYIAPYLGRMTEAGKDGAEECLKMQEVAEGMNSEVRILVASIRDAQTMIDLAADGMETFTFAPSVARELFVEPLTAAAAKDFEDAAARNS
jgi:transaldolase